MLSSGCLRPGVVAGPYEPRASGGQVRKTVALICQQVIAIQLAACDWLEYLMFLFCSLTRHVSSSFILKYIYEYICIPILITAWGFLSLSRFSAHTCKMIYVAMRRGISFFPISVVCEDKNDHNEKKNNLALGP